MSFRNSKTFSIGNVFYWNIGSNHTPHHEYVVERMPRPTNHRLDDVLRAGMDMQADAEAEAGAKRPRVSPPPLHHAKTKLEVHLKPPIRWEVLDKESTVSPLVNFDYSRVPPFPQFQLRAYQDYDLIQPVSFRGTIDEITAQLGAFKYQGAPLLNSSLYSDALEVVSDLVFDDGAVYMPMNASKEDREAVREYKNYLKKASDVFELLRVPGIDGLEFVNSIKPTSIADRAVVTLPRLAFVHHALTAQEESGSIRFVLDALLDVKKHSERDICEFWFQCKSILDTLENHKGWTGEYEEELNDDYFVSRIIRAADPREEIRFYANQEADPAIQQMMWDEMYGTGSGDEAESEETPVETQ